MNAHDDPSLIDEGDIDSLGHAHSVDVAAGRKNDRRSRPKRRSFSPLIRSNKPVRIAKPL